MSKLDRAGLNKKYAAVTASLIPKEEILSDVRNILKMADTMQDFLLKYVSAYNMARLAALLPEGHPEKAKAVEALHGIHKVLIERGGLERLTDIALSDALNQLVGAAMTGDPEALDVIEKLDKAMQK